MWIVGRGCGAATITERTIITLNQVLRVVHCGYRCPVVECAGHNRLYRSSEADALALIGFAFGLDIVLFVGQHRLREHQTVDEIHQTLMQRLEAVGQRISRREILFLFEAYAALLRTRTEVHQDEAWKEQAQKNEGLLLSIDGIQPDKGNETIYLIRDVLTGRILNADNVTDSTKDRLKQILTPVVTLCEQGTCRLDIPLIYANRSQHRVLAQASYREGLSLWQEMHQVEQRLGIVKGLAGLAEMAAAQGQAERAGRLFGPASRLLPATRSYREQVNRRSTAARARLGAVTYEVG